MSVLQFMTRGGMGNESTSPDFTENDKALLRPVFVKLNDLLASELYEKSIDITSANLFSCQTLICIKHRGYFHIIFAKSYGGNSVHYLQTEEYEDTPYVDLPGIQQKSFENFMKQVKEDKNLLCTPIFGFFISKKQIKNGFSEYLYTILTEYIKGIERPLQEKKDIHNDIDEKLCFVIMSFSKTPDLKNAYEMAIKPAIKELGYECIRIDETEHNGKISEAIIENIKKAKFIVADLTENRPNCYYELGYAHALEKTVIHLTNNADSLHFDIKDYNFISYENDLPGLKASLLARIRKTVL